MLTKKQTVRLLLLYVTVCCSVVYGQDYQTSVQFFGQDLGLSDRNLNCSFKDSRGFAWVGTNLGINRFDGIQYRAYTKESHGLSKNKTVKIAEDVDGLLWLLYGNDYNACIGLDIFDPIAEISTPLAQFLEKPLPFKIDKVVNLHLIPQKGLLIILNDGTIYQYLNKSFRLFTQIKSSEAFSYAYALPDGSTWLGASQHLIKLNTTGEVTQEIKLSGYLRSLIGTDSVGKPFYTISELRSGISPTYLCLGNEKLAQVPDTHAKVIALDIQNKKIYTVQARYQFNRLVVLDLEGREIESNKSVLSFQSEALFFLNPEVWVGTPEDGLVLIQTKQSKFRKYLHNRLTVYNLPYGVRGMALVSEHQLVVNGLGKSFLLDIRDGNAQEFAQNIRFYHAQTGGFFNGLAVLKDDQGDIWFTDERIQLVCYNPTSQNIRNYSYQGDILEQLRLNRVSHQLKVQPMMQWSLHQDKTGKLWIGHQKGLSYFDQNSETVKLFENYQGFESLQNSSVYHFYANSTGLWLVTNTGLYLFNPQNGEVEDWFHEQGDEEYRLPHNHLTHVFEDDEGYFWLTTKGGGLVKWHPETKETKQYTKQNGLADNVLYAVYTDDFGKLWLSSNQGIMRFDRETQEVNTYLPEDGLTDKEFNTISHFQAPDGKLYFGSINGITTFHPKDFVLGNQTSYPLTVTGLKKQSRNTGLFTSATTSMINSRKIDLKPDDLGFVLDFVYLNFKPQKVRYAYKIEGLDQDWNYLNTPQIRISSLPYGNYTLLIKAQGNLGIWETPDRIAITQHKPFYLETWFIGLCILMFCIGVLTFIRYRTYRYEQEQKRLEAIIANRTATIAQQANELKALDRVKSKFFANISHELRTPLTLILGPIAQLLAQEQTEKNEKLLLRAKRNGESLLQMIKEILDLSKLEANKLEVNRKPTQLSSFLRFLMANFESQAQHQGIDFQFEFSSEHDLTLLLDQQKVEQIVNNLLSNAFKFTPSKGQILMKSWTMNEKQFIAIIDSGAGIATQDLPYVFDRYFQSKHDNNSAQGGTGIGLALAQELAHLMQGDLQAKSKLGEGSTFTFEFPIIKSEEPIHPPTNDDHETATKLTVDNAQPAIAKDYLLLLVEDNLDMQQFISELLIDTYQIEIANNGLEAISYLESNAANPDLIISDVMMPEMDGFELLNRLKSQTDWMGIPVIMLTARAAEDDKLHALTIGVDDYLTKPFASLELKARIANLLANYQLRIGWKSEYKKQNVSIDKTEESAELMEVDLEWIGKVQQTIKQEMLTADFTLQKVADQYHLSFRQFQRRVKKITGLSPKKYQQEIQLQLGRELLERGVYRGVEEVAWAVGFETTSYFSKLYKNRFGKLPKEYLV